MKYFSESQDASYCILGNLVDKESGSATVINELRSDENTTPVTTALDNMDYSDLLSVTTAHREAYGLTSDDNLFIAVAWVYTGELRLLRQFPHVIKVDDTSHTNNEKRPHLTFTSQTSSGKIFTWLRVFLPNKSAGCFRWIFSFVLPKLIGNDILRKIRVAITDGDSQETSQLDVAIRTHFPRVQRVRCGWHLVEKGWQSFCPGEQSVQPAKKADFKYLIHIIKYWLYSWMRPGFCETEQEYHVSKAWLFSFLQSPRVLAICDDKEHIPRQILEFVTRHVIPHEDYYAFYHRKFVFHFDEFNNCSHEGTNNGVKSGAVAVLPGHDISSAGKRLHFQGKLRCVELAKSAAKEFISRELWCEELHTIHDICTRGQSLIVNEWAMRAKYAVERCTVSIGADSWNVIVMTTHREIMGSDCTEVSKDWEKLPIPIFPRVRTVTILSSGRLYCNCAYSNKRKALLQCIVNYDEHTAQQIVNTYGVTKFNGYNCQTHMAVGYEHIELIHNGCDAPC